MSEELTPRAYDLGEFAMGYVITKEPSPLEQALRDTMERDTARMLSPTPHRSLWWRLRSRASAFLERLANRIDPTD